MGTDYIKTYLTKDGFDLLNLLNDDFFKPVKLLYNHRHYVSATKLLMNFIDTIGFIDFGDTGENTFVKWLDKYADLAALGVTSEELWEHRNSLLHMSNLDSRKVLAGKVKRLAWYIGEIPTGVSMSYPDYKLYNLFELIKTLVNACGKWADSYNSDPTKFTTLLDRYDLVVSDNRPGMIEIKGDDADVASENE